MAVMGFRAFLVMDNKVARQVMAENGSHGFPRVSRHDHQGEQVDDGQNGRKWVAAVIW